MSSSWARRKKGWTFLLARMARTRPSFYRRLKCLDPKGYRRLRRAMARYFRLRKRLRTRL
ncbi:MAG: hypothetical protein LBP92_07830 [Deltaproteobacteria bacterium]|nr:hypothetical protein [Deltaproteobacteria bacterium]